MKFNYLKSLTSKQINLIFFAIFLIICIVVTSLCFLYYWQLQETMTLETSGYLQEISKQMGNNVSSTIEDNFSILETILTVLKSSENPSYAQLQSVISSQQSYWNYQNVFLIDGNGRAYDANGAVVRLNGDQYLQDAIVGRKRSMSSSQVINGTECILFVIPVENMKIGATEIHALGASYDLSTFDRILSMTAFDGKSYAHIIQKDGSMVVRSSSPFSLKIGYNLLNSLSAATLHEGYSMDLLHEDIQEGRSGMLSYTLEGISKYMAYTPLNTEEWYLMTFVPVSVVNQKSELLLGITLLLCGLITLCFSLLFGALMFSSLQHKNKLERIAFVDPITGGHTSQKFYALAEIKLSHPDHLQYALIYTNIAKFKIFNEQFGRRACDEMLQHIHNGISQDLSTHECLGRLSADNFCILLECADETSLLQRFEKWYSVAEASSTQGGNIWLSPFLEFGVYVICNDSLSFPNMIDRAKLALKETTQSNNRRLRCAIYDDEVRRRLFREKHLEDIMEGALRNNEFQVYLQPKYLAATEAVGGAEALVRWMSSSEGMIYPDEFISLFEKNGFIVQLDTWVFTEVCRTLRLWLDSGMTPLKVSVNCSRVHLKNPHFLDDYCAICNENRVPPRFVEIELTESMVFEDVDHLTKTIDAIHKAGFGCSMDDFGSGYSSLNLIQDIPVDTIKLDKIFFQRTSQKSNRTEAVVSSILTMTKSLQIQTVAEGVEEREQVDMLKRLGCDYIQGYYFAKPMPIPAFEQLTFGEDAAKILRDAPTIIS